MQLNSEVTDTLIDRLAADLETSDFSVGTLSELWGERAEQALHRGERVPALRALAARRASQAPQSAETSSSATVSMSASASESEPAVTLASLFLLGVPVDASALAAAVPTLGLDGAVELGLVAVEGGQARALVDLRPYSFVDTAGAGSWWIVSDLGEMVLDGALTTDHVLGVGGASLTLSGLMVSRSVERVLDLGTGCGIQALHAARHAGHVVATDISARALEIAALNARLNGVHNIEFRLGDMFEPVEGERFDQIVTNPPFVITPRRADVPAYEYRDGGRIGDGIMREVVTGVGRHLNPGGIAQMLGNWEYRAGEDGFDRVRGWVQASDAPLDAWLIERERQDPAAYAETWIRDGGTRSGTPDFDRLYNAWLDDFAERGVESVGFGYLTLRRAQQDPQVPQAAEPLSRFERMPDALAASSGLGTPIAAVLDAHDWIAAHDDDALWRATLQVAPDVTEERNYWPGNDDPSTITLKQGGGFARTVKLDTALAALVGASDGELPVGVIVEAIAQLLEADVPALRQELLPRLRQLILDGFVQPLG
jgi:methylase of polypeptide subunit release factors